MAEGLRALLVPADPDQKISLVTVKNEWGSLARAVGAEYFERVTVTKTMKLVVDESGRLNGSFVNYAISGYFYPGIICGDVLVLSEEYTDKGPDFCSLTDEDLSEACARLGIEVPEGD